MSKKFSTKTKIILFFIFFVSLILRFYKITSIPDSFDGDEAAFGYYGYSLGKEGTDEYGKKFPIYFESIGDYKYPVYAYLTILPVKIFGLNEFSSRFWSAFSGSLLIIVVFFLSFLIWKNKNIALFSSFSLAISPWHILFSRGTYEANLAVFFVATGFLFLILYIKKETNISKLVISLAFFLLAIYTYSAQRAFICLMLFFLVIFLWREKHKKRKIITCISSFFILIVFISSFPWQSRARAESIGIFKVERKYLIDQDIQDDGIAFPGKGSLLVTRIFHNKYNYLILDFLSRYFSHFDPNFLFVYGDKLRPENSIPSFGLLYLIEAPFLILGLLNLTKKESTFGFFPLIWFFLGPVSSSLTIETPNAIRSLLTVPGIAMILGVGLESFFSSIKKLRLQIIVFLVILTAYIGNFSFGLHQYLIHKFYHQPWYTDYGVKEMVEETTKLAPKYKAVVIPQDPYIFFLFYNKILPSQFLKTAKFTPREQKQWGRVESFDKFVFNMPYKCPKIGKLNVLYVCTGTEIPINSRLLNLIRFKDGVPAFSLIEFYPLSQVPLIKPILPRGLNYMIESDSSNDGLLPDSWPTFW